MTDKIAELIESAEKFQRVSNRYVRELLAEIKQLRQERDALREALEEIKTEAGNAFPTDEISIIYGITCKTLKEGGER